MSVKKLTTVNKDNMKLDIEKHIGYRKAEITFI
jgi:hypothetical protein